MPPDRFVKFLTRMTEVSGEGGTNHLEKGGRWVVRHG